ncbi:GmrSD restriction endonuclease domain-containing protein [Paenibacillus sp. 23TSA30-6]|uniref:GmrSD restriction endonuclease domain-containing protein n=1 Tax=Paenibacillus sp. 23TSA30-6 TaxID=2546104 RepID=UPI001787B0CD|nr:DUF262 domain-containing protein [Paenibacillus sp. 23TSA30-6]MBE0337278.1 DUF262 domain-containing protein [Paenibacillus sp. 23TSA30-6]
MEQGHITIDSLYNDVKSGNIRIPSFQRGFVWNPDQVAFLYDSIYKGFPIGNLLLWETTRQLKSEKNIGSMALPDIDGKITVQYVLDGQQRLTSLCALFNREILAKDNADWIDIYFDLEGTENGQTSLFSPLKLEEVITNRHFPVYKIMDSVEYRKATRDLDEDKAVKLDIVMRNLSTTVIPIEKMKTDNMNHVAIVFERVNTAGTELDHYQLLSAWSWSEDFVLQDRFSQLADELESFGIDSSNSQHIDLLLKCCTSVIKKEASTNAIINLDGIEVRNRFNAIENGIKSAIEFLKKELHIYHIKYVPYPAMLIPLTKFFESEREMGDSYNDKQRSKLVKWFWKTCFSKRYSSAIDTKYPRDIRDMERLKNDPDASVFVFESNISKDFFISNQFNPQTIATKTFITMLANSNPRSFISGTTVDLDKTLRKSYKTEFHHIFPHKFLEKKGIQKKDIFALANFCFLSKADNLKISDKAPFDYQSLINDKESVLKSALCPLNSFELPFNKFVSERSKLLLKRAGELIS